MVTTRILERRRTESARPRRPPRRRSQPRLGRLAHDVSRSRGRFGSFGRTYLAAALILAGLVLYLVQAAHVTATSYQIQRLESEQSDLLSQQEQLRYREASLQAPARLQQEATVAGFTRVQPSRYLQSPAVNVDLGAAPQLAADHQSSRWQDLIAALTGTHDAAAAGR